MHQDWLKFEKEAKALGYKFIAGIDEAGRGPLAGPVVAAAVILKSNIQIPGVNDSKKLTESKRNDLFEIITNHPDIIYCISRVEHTTIDEINILNATLLAMKQAVDGLSICPDLLLVDGNKSVNSNIPCRPIVKGDSLSLSIAIASILAKVTRDQIMDKLHEEMPQYDFKKHKGYPTIKHKLLIQEHGLSKYHRKTFKSSI